MVQVEVHGNITMKADLKAFVNDKPCIILQQCMKKLIFVPIRTCNRKRINKKYFKLRLVDKLFS